MSVTLIFARNTIPRYMCPIFSFTISNNILRERIIIRKRKFNILFSTAFKQSFKRTSGMNMCFTATHFHVFWICRFDVKRFQRAECSKRNFHCWVCLNILVVQFFEGKICYKPSTLKEVLVLFYYSHSINKFETHLDLWFIGQS